MSEPTIYVDRERRKASIRDACEVMTTFWIDSEEYSGQTVFDCVAAMRWQQAKIERLKQQKIMRQSQVYHAMKLVDRMTGRKTCDATFMADVDEAIARANRLGPPRSLPIAGGAGF